MLEEVHTFNAYVMHRKFALRRRRTSEAVAPELDAEVGGAGEDALAFGADGGAVAVSAVHDRVIG